MAVCLCTTVSVSVAQECLPEILNRFDGIPELWDDNDAISNGGINCLQYFDSGSGPELYAGGKFNKTNDDQAFLGNGIAKWDGTQWSSLLGGVVGGGGAGLNLMTVSTMTVWDDGTGEALYIGGNFNFAGGVQTNGLAKWDGTSYSQLAGGVHTGSGPILPTDLTPFDDGTGEALYIVGNFSFVDNGPFLGGRFAKWDGTSLTQVPGGGSQLPTEGGRYLSGAVTSAEVYDDGTGPALYLAGGFSLVDGNTGTIIGSKFAKWDGTELFPLGNGSTNGVGSAQVVDLLVFDDGSGSKLYACGAASILGISRWDGSSWEAISDDLFSSDGQSPSLQSIEVMDLGDGPTLYTYLGEYFIRWDGEHWYIVNYGYSGFGVVNTFTSAIEDGQPVLYTGGTFEYSVANEAAFDTRGIVKTSFCTQDSCSADLTGDGSLNFLDVSEFLSAFGSMEPSADFNTDGSFNFLDVSEFLAAFSEGCP